MPVWGWGGGGVGDEACFSWPPLVALERLRGLPADAKEIFNFQWATNLLGRRKGDGHADRGSFGLGSILTGPQACLGAGDRLDHCGWQHERQRETCKKVRVCMCPSLLLLLCCLGLSLPPPDSKRCAAFLEPLMGWEWHRGGGAPCIAVSLRCEWGALALPSGLWVSLGLTPPSPFSVYTKPLGEASKEPLVGC